MRLLPGSLYGRMVLVLAASLLLSQGASLLVNFFDRGSSIYRLNAEQMVNRIARTASLINRLPQNARQAVVAELGAKSDFRVQLVNQPIEIESGFAELNQYEKNFAASIRDAMHPPLLTTVEITRAARAESPDEVEPPNATAFETWLARRFYFMLPATFSVVAQVELEDGTSAAFFVRMPQEPLSQLEALVPRLLMWAAIILLMSLLIGRVITRSLRKTAARYTTTVDRAFPDVLAACADPKRPDGWIDDRIAFAYTALHQAGYAHSIETWDADGRLVGGLYGVHQGGLFAGESIWAPGWVVSVSFMCGMVACGCGSWQAINNTLHISGRNMLFIQSSQIVGLFPQFCLRCMERCRQSVQFGS